MSSTVRKSTHAQQRQQHRAVSEEELELVLQHGRQIRQPGGRIAWFVGEKEVLEAKLRGLCLEAARNLGVVQAEDGTIVTVVRSADVRRLRRWGRRA